MTTGHDLIGRRNGCVCAISLVYQFDPDVSGVYYEIGTMRLIAGGFGLQVCLTCLRLMQIWLEDDPGALAFSLLCWSEPNPSITCGTSEAWMSGRRRRWSNSFKACWRLYTA